MQGRSLVLSIQKEKGSPSPIIQMTLTAPNCPMADMLVEDVNIQVAKVKGVDKVNVILVFEPAWDKSMMSEEALLELNLF